MLAALSPYHAARFFTEDVHRGFIVLGAVFLVVTGGEALYADLGHFGHRAIQIAWFAVALVLAAVHVGGIPRSTDGGETWAPTVPIEYDVHEVRIAPADPAQ